MASIFVSAGENSEDVILENDSMTVLDGGVANGTSIEGGLLRVRNGGVVNSTSVDGGWNEDDVYLPGSLLIEKGGVANDTTVAGGEFVVSSGGVADNVELNGGKFTVQSGGSAYDVNIGLEWDPDMGGLSAEFGGYVSSVMLSQGSVDVTSGGDVNYVFVNNATMNVKESGMANAVTLGDPEEDYDSEYGKARLLVSAGGSANGVVVNYDTELDVAAGAVAEGVVENGGYVHVAEGAVVSFNQNSFGDYEYDQWQSASIHSGTTANNITVNGGVIDVFDGGTINGLSFNYGILDVYGGVLDDVTIGLEAEEDAPVVARIAGTVNGATIVDGKVTVMAGGKVGMAGIEGGSLFVEKDGLVSATTLGAGEDADYGYDGEYYGYGILEIADGGKASDLAVNGGGMLTVNAGGQVDYLTVNGGAIVTIKDGATVTGVTWTPCEGTLTIEDGASVSFANQYTGVYYREWDDDEGEERTVNVRVLNCDGEDFEGDVYVMAGGTFEQANYLYGTVSVWNGGVTDSIILSGGNIVVYNGGKANEISVVGGMDDYYDEEGTPAILTIKDGGTATNTSVTGDGIFRLENGAVANSTAVGANPVYDEDDEYYYEEDEIPPTASFEVADGATANGVTVAMGGKLTVKDGGTATEVKENGGYVEIADGAKVTFRENAFRNLTLSYGKSASVHAGTTAYSITVAGGSLEAFEGGVLNGLRFVSGTLLADGATMTNTIIGVSGDDEDYYYDEEEGVFQFAEVSDSTLTNTTLYNGRFSVAGGSANETVLNGGRFSLNDGATGSDITVNAGLFYIESGASASNITVGGRWSEDDEYDYDEEDPYASSAQLCVKDDGSVASDITIDRGGWFYVEEGAVADNITINAGGHLHVDAGATATNVHWTPCQSDIYIEEGAVVTFADDEFSGVYFKRYDDEEATAGHAWKMYDQEFQGHMYVMADGLVEKSNVNGELYVYDGGTVNDITWSGNGKFTVLDGGVANGTVIYASEDYDGEFGYMGFDPVVSGGGTVNDTLVLSGAVLRLEDGAVANGTTVVAGKLELEAGAVANNTTIKADPESEYGREYDEDGHVYDYGYGYLNVAEGATANGVTVKAGGILNVASGGTATNVDWTPCTGGRLSAEDGAVVTFANELSGVYYGDEDHLTSQAATMNFKTVGINDDEEYSNRLMYVMDSGSVTKTSVIRGGALYVNGGKADRTTVAGGEWYSGTVALMTVADGGVANRTSVGGFAMDEWGDYYYASGTLYVGNGGIANKTEVNDNSLIRIENGGIAKDTTLDGTYGYAYDEWDEMYLVSSFASMCIADGGTAVNTEISDGVVFVSSGGVMSNFVIDTLMDADYASSSSENYDEELYTTYTAGIHLSAGGKLTGQMTFLNNAKVFASNGAIIDFDLTNAAAGGAALMNDLSVVIGAPTYTLTVNGMQTAGTYRLADGISTFSGTLAVIASGTQIGTLSVGRKLAYGSVDYKLGIVDNALTVTVQAATGSGEGGEVIPPVAGNPAVLSVTADITEQTTSDVLVTATFNSDSVYKEYSFDCQSWGAYPGGILLSSNRTVYFRSLDAAGNASKVVSYEVTNIQKVSIDQPRIVEYSTDNFEHVFRVQVSSDALDSFRLPAGTYQSRVRLEDSSEWLVSDEPIVSSVASTPTFVKSDEDGNVDVFFANASGTWESGYAAKHTGILGGWSGTGDAILLSGKNQLADIFEGSSDANILLMTDDKVGDALFVDDIFTALPGTVEDQQARIAQIDEIRAGAGADVVDMTSQRFVYVGDGLTIRGGDGDDTIWANNGDNWLFGDAGNDRLVGASGNDVIVGGIGNDSMHGGGGDDVFAFCDNWGVDTVEQLSDGFVTLWFESGRKANWDAETLTYTDGDNSVTVKGVSAEQITLKFGSDGSEQFSALSDAGAFDEFSSQKVFEESGKGVLASL